MFRAEVLVPERTKQMIEAIKDKDFNKFAEITIKDSNQFHAVCQVGNPEIGIFNGRNSAIHLFLLYK